MRVNKKSEKAGVRLKIKKKKKAKTTKITAYGKGRSSDRFYFLRLQNHGGP